MVEMLDSQGMREEGERSGGTLKLVMEEKEKVEKREQKGRKEAANPLSIVSRNISHLFPAILPTSRHPKESNLILLILFLLSFHPLPYSIYDPKTTFRPEETISEILSIDTGCRNVAMKH